MPIRRCCRHTTKPVIPMIYRILQNRANSLACAWAINSLAYSIVYPFLPIYLHSERGYPMATVGLIFPLMGGSIIVSPLLAGYLTDRIGRQFMMQFGQTARAAMFLLLAGISPKFAALLTTIPQCVLGGATVTVFSTIAMTGMKLIASQDLTARNTTIVGLSAALGVGISQASEALSQFPEAFTMVFGQSPVVIATIMAVLLNLILPKEK